MKMKLPREPHQGNSGYYGGVGSKPGHKPWTPRARKADAPATPDPARKRIARLQLTRRRRAHPSDHAGFLPVPIVVAMLIVGLYLLGLLLGWITPG